MGLSPQDPFRARTGVQLAQCATLVVVILLVHQHVYTIPYLYSEIIGIERNSVVTDLGTYRERMLTPRGLLARPISVLSYALNHAVHGNAVFGFHLVNVVVHCVNTLLVFLIAARLFAAPFASALVFALHPLASSCVSQIFGRNYSLASTFFFAAFFLYATWRQRGRLRPWQMGLLGFLLLATVLTKQSLVVLPLLLLWWELGRGTRFARPSIAVITCAALSAAAGLAMIVFYAAPLSRTAPVPPTTFLLSQLGNVPTLVRLYLLPYQNALVHDLLFYRSVLHPDVWIGAGVVLGLLLVAWRWRSRPLAWLLGAILICLLPTNTVLPKNDIIREWRLYPSLLFFALFVGSLTARVAEHRGRAVAYCLLGLVLCTYAHSNMLQNHAYQSGLAAWRQVLDRYPHSSDAMNNIGLHLARRGDLAGARQSLLLATRHGPDTAVYWANLALVQQQLGETEQARTTQQYALELARRHGPQVLVVRYAGEPGAEALVDTP